MGINDLKQPPQEEINLGTDDLKQPPQAEIELRKWSTVNALGSAISDREDIDTNYRNNSNKQMYESFVEKVQDYHISKRPHSDSNLWWTTSQECVLRFWIEAKDILRKTWIVFDDGWEIVDVLSHVSGSQRWASIWVSRNGKKWNDDCKVYEIRPGEKIFQRQQGIDYSKFK